MTKAVGGVLRKKISAIQTGGYSLPIQGDLSAALEYAATKGATAALRVTTEALVEHSRVGRLDSVIDALPEPGLLARIEFSGGDVAVFGFDMQVVDHVVDVLAGGDPDRSRSTPARPPTTIDAALCTQVIEAILTQFDDEIRVLTGGVGLDQFQVGRIEHTPANLRYTLTDQQYLIFRVNLDIGDDARSGSFRLVLALSTIEPIENVLREPGTNRAQGESESWGRQMRAAVSQTRIRLTAVIDRCRMPVGEISRLNVGALFPLSDVTLDDVALEVQTASEIRVLGRGRLGAFKRNKAVRLIEPLDRTFLDPLADVLGTVSIDMDTDAKPDVDGNDSRANGDGNKIPITPAGPQQA